MMQAKLKKEFDENENAIYTSYDVNEDLASEWIMIHEDDEYI